MDAPSSNADPLHHPDGAEGLHPEVYCALRKLAATHMARQRKDQTLQATILVHEAWLRMSKPGRRWRDQNHFFAAASIAMRHILIDHARHKSRQRRGGNLRKISLASLQELQAPGRSDLILLLDEGITQLEKHNPERARVVVDRFFGGMTDQEIALSMGVGVRTVERHWAIAKVWLLRWIQETTQARAEAVA